MDCVFKKLTLIYEVDTRFFGFFFFFKDVFPPSNILLFFSLSTKFFSCFENITCYLNFCFFLSLLNLVFIEEFYF